MLVPNDRVRVNYRLTSRYDCDHTNDSTVASYMNYFANNGCKKGDALTYQMIAIKVLHR